MTDRLTPVYRQHLRAARRPNRQVRIAASAVWGYIAIIAITAALGLYSEAFATWLEATGAQIMGVLK